MSLHTLPREIIELLSTFTTKQDLINIVLVSKSWYTLFHSYIYRYITINSQEKFHKIITCFKKQNLPSSIVHQLDLKHMKLSEQGLQDLQDLFSNINTLRFDWCVWPSSIQITKYDDSEISANSIHPPQGLPPALSRFFASISRGLQSLSINAQNHVLTDIWSILALCPHLKHLELLNLNYEHDVTLGYFEMIHTLCPHIVSLKINCTRSDPNPALMPQFQQHCPIHIRPVSLKHLTLSSLSGSAKWPLWLPYFAVKYPHLEHILFKHAGIGSDGYFLDVPDSVFEMFNQSCPHLKSMRWRKISVHQDKAFSKRTLRYIEAYEDFTVPNRLLRSPVFQKNTLPLIASLTLGQPPASITTTEILQVVGQCPNLTHLTIQACSEYAMDEILLRCTHVTHLVLKNVSVSWSRRRYQISQHPLKTLTMKRASFTEGVFSTLSQYCPYLRHVDLAGCVQTDRRDQVQIDLGNLHLSTLSIQGLRTRKYYIGCRIRFFAVNDTWYYMTMFDTIDKKLKNIECAQCLERLDRRDIHKLNTLVTTKTLKGWDVESATCHLKEPFTEAIDPHLWHPENIYYSGLVKITCQSVQNLIINNKRVITQ